jgi:putative phage DNA polymerase
LFIQKDVNNYIGVKGNYIKCKGGDVNKFTGNKYFSNNNARIIDIAVVNKLVYNKDVLETLIENRDKPELYQYILQAGRTYLGTFDQDNKKYQNINRVFACRNEGIQLCKKRLDGGLVKFADAPEKMFLWNDDCGKLENFEKIVDINHYYQIIEKKLKMWET